jgi:transposase-like protein
MPRHLTPFPPCPHPDCSVQDAEAIRPVKRYGFYRLKRGRRRRYRCRSCGRTFSRTTQTLYYRLRSSQITLERITTMSVEGISRSTIARVEHLSRPTIDRWLDRACEAAQHFNDQLIHNVPLQELQADEIQTMALDTAWPSWIFTTLEVWSRLWVSTVVGRRSRHNADQLFQDTMSRGDLAELCLVTTDGYSAYVGVIRDVLGEHCVYAQVVKTWRNNRVIKVIQKQVIGTAAQLHDALDRSEDSTMVNASYVERLNLTIRQCCAYLGRRRLSHARRQHRLHGHLELVRCFYNFIRPHRALKFGTMMRTPAMQAGLASRRLRFRDIFRAVRAPSANLVCNT